MCSDARIMGAAWIKLGFCEAGVDACWAIRLASLVHALKHLTSSASRAITCCMGPKCNSTAPCRLCMVWASQAQTENNMKPLQLATCALLACTCPGKQSIVACFGIQPARVQFQLRSVGFVSCLTHRLGLWAADRKVLDRLVVSPRCVFPLVCIWACAPVMARAAAGVASVGGAYKEEALLVSGGPLVKDAIRRPDHLITGRLLHA